MSLHGRRRAAGALTGTKPVDTSPPPAPPPATPILSGAWVNGQQGSDAAVLRVTDFGTWRGAPLDLVTHFLRADSWSAYEDPSSFPYVKKNLDAGRMVEIAMTPFAAGVSANLAGAAAGSYTSHWDTVLSGMAAAGLNSANTIIRFGWEMNTPYFLWGIKNTAVSGSDFYASAANFVTAWRLFKGRRDALLPLAKLNWCPNLGYTGTGVSHTDCYPGAAWVDMHGTDFYNQYYGRKFPTTGTQAEKDQWNADCWNTIRNGGGGLVDMCNYAASQGKPMSFGEWGCLRKGDGYGGGDDPTFIQNVRTFFDTTARGLVPAGIHHESYFNNKTGTTEYSYLGPDATDFPNASAKYRELW